MLRLPSVLRLSLLVSVVAFLGLASFPGTAAEASSLERPPVSLGDQDATSLEALVGPASAPSLTVVAPEPAFAFDGYRR